MYAGDGGNTPYRYFFILRKGKEGVKTREIEEQFEKENGERFKAESKLKEKYGIVRYFIFRNHTRYVKACQKLVEYDTKKSLDMIATFNSNKVPDGFTTIDLGDGKAKAQEELQGLNMFKIDLRTKTGKKIFDEFYELRNGETGEELKLGDYVANRFGLYHQLVPGYQNDIKEIYSSVVTETEDCWLVASPKFSFNDSDEIKGLPDDYTAEIPVVEVGKNEYFEKLKEHNNALKKSAGRKKSIGEVVKQKRAERAPQQTLLFA